MQEPVPKSTWQRVCPNQVWAHPTLTQIAEYLARPETLDSLSAHDVARTYPAGVVARLFELGLGALLAGDGDGDFSIATTFHRQALLERAGAASGSLGIIIGVNPLALGVLYLGENASLQDRILADVRAGQQCSLVLTELNHGSDLRRTETEAVPGTLSEAGLFVPLSDGNEQPTHYRLHGDKDLINGGAVNAWLITLARVSASGPRGGMTLFALPRDETIRVSERWTTLPAPASDISSIALVNTIVPAEHVIGSVGGGLRLVMQTLTRARGGVGALAAGTSHRAAVLTADYLHNRTIHGRPLVDLPVLVEHLLELEAIDLAVACQANKGAAVLNSPEIEPAYYTAITKLGCSYWAEHAVDEGRRVFSARALLEEEPYTRLVRDAPLYSVFDGTRHVILSHLAKYVRVLTEDGDGPLAADVLGAAYLADPLASTAHSAPNLSRPTVLPLGDHFEWLADKATTCTAAATALARLSRVLISEMARRIADGGWKSQTVAFAGAEAVAHLEMAAALIELGHAPCRAALGIPEKHQALTHDDLLVSAGVAILGTAAAGLVLRMSADPEPDAGAALAAVVGDLARQRDAALNAFIATFPRRPTPHSSE